VITQVPITLFGGATIPLEINPFGTSLLRNVFRGVCRAGINDDHLCEASKAI
jgi:hypothetical protein